jgi:hypothetical protein
MKYEWLDDKRRFPINAQVAGEALARLTSEQGGRLTPEFVIEASRPPDAPLHKCFTWNDEKAADLYRRVEAHKLIRSVRVVREKAGEPAAQVVRAFVPTKDDTGKHFRPATIVSRAEQVRIAINAALDGLVTARERLAPFHETEKFYKGVKGCEVEVRQMREAAKKVCAQLEAIEDGLIVQLMPPKPQPIRDVRRVASI